MLIQSHVFSSNIDASPHKWSFDWMGTKTKQKKENLPGKVEAVIAFLLMAMILK